MNRAKAGYIIGIFVLNFFVLTKNTTEYTALNKTILLSDNNRQKKGG